MASTITYRALQECDVEQVKEIMHYIFFGPQDGDPISQVLKYEIPRETQCYVDGVMPGAIADGLSVVAVKEGSGEIVGIRLSHHITRENPRKLVLSLDDPDTRKMWITMDILNQAQDGVDIFEKFNVTNYVHFIGLAVKPGNRGLGIAKNLVEKAFGLAKAKGATVVAAFASSLYSKKIFDKLGFETLSEMHYQEYMVDGERLCSESGINGHKYCSLCVKGI